MIRRMVFRLWADGRDAIRSHDYIRFAKALATLRMIEKSL